MMAGIRSRGALALALSVSACNSALPPASSTQPTTAPATPSTGVPMNTSGGAPASATAPTTGGSPATLPPGSSVPLGGAPSVGDAPTLPAGGSAAPPVGTVPIAGAGGAMVAVAGSGAVTPPPPTAAGPMDWTMMGYDLGSSYFNTAETTISKDTAAKLDVAWQADMGGNVYGAALQVGDNIYASGPSYVKAFEAASGKELWKASVGSTSAMSFADGTLYLNDNDSKINAINAADGKVLWAKQADPGGADGSSSAIPAGDLVLVGGSDGVAELSGGGTFRGYLAALKRSSGEMGWTTYTVAQGTRGASIWSTPSVDLAAGIAYAGTGNNYGAPASDTSDSIIAFDLKTGAIKWKNQRVMGDTFGGGVGPDSDFGANPVLYETMVGGTPTQLVAGASKGGSVHSIKRADGMLAWTRSLGTGAADGSSGIFTNLAWAGKLLIVAINQGGPATLFGLDGATGDIVWMRTLQAQVWGRTAVANGVGFVGTGTKVEAFDVDTGKVIKSFSSKGGTVACTITVAHGRVAFGEGLSWSTSGVRGSTLTVLAIK